LKVRVYPNECVKRVIAFVPRQHLHLRLIIELCDQTIVLHEATVAAIVRAFANIVLHPTRRAIELKHTELRRQERKPMYAKHQLIEIDRHEIEILEEAEKIINEGIIACNGCAEPTDAESDDDAPRMRR